MNYFNDSNELRIMDITVNPVFKEELRKMILSADQSVHDISKYKMDYVTMNEALLQLIQGDCFIENCAYGDLRLLPTKEGSIMKAVRIAGIFDDYYVRLEKLKATISKIYLGLDEKMTELEKALYVHDFIIENSVYKNKDKFSFYACGPLAYGYGVCSGYSSAFQFVMTLLGIKTSYVISNSMNHEWPYIYLDNAWYHIDITWDDTEKLSEAPLTHYYFVRNDKEFSDSSLKKHHDWYTPTNAKSTSEKYKNLFVHDVIGKLYYQSGYWYYYQSNINSIVRNTIDGIGYKILLDGHDITEKIKLVLVSNMQIKCEINNETIVINI